MLKNSLTCLALFLSPLLLNAQSFQVTVKVIDSSGRPVEKAEPGIFWTAVAGKMKSSNAKPILTDMDGKAKITVDDWKEKRPLLVLSEDRLQGGWAGVSAADDGKVVEVKLSPTAKVIGKLGSQELGKAIEWGNTTVKAKGFRAFNVQFITQKAEFEFILPIGDYVLDSYGYDVKSTKTVLNVSGDKSEIDLGMIDIKASTIAKLKGKPCPEFQLVDARGVKKTVQISDYKGKWVYLEFWGFW
jgi:hypothetical protein